jgi:hypothetical protein
VCNNAYLQEQHTPLEDIYGSKQYPMDSPPDWSQYCLEVQVPRSHGTKPPNMPNMSENFVKAHIINFSLNKPT